MNITALDTLFQRAGCTALKPSVLQPADPFLNAAGEAFRKSLFVTTRADGETLCLRPEFTIPVCLEHQGGPARYHYRGTVFRQSTGLRNARPQEFQQAGVEALGETDFAKADADMVRLALEAVRLLSNINLVVVIGDPAFFNAMVTPIGLPEIWRERLIRSFGDADLVATMLQRMIGTPTAPDGNFKGLDVERLTEKVAAMMRDQGILDAGGRSPQEVAQRFLKKRAEQVPVEPKAAEICQLFMALQCANAHVGETMRRFGVHHGVDFSEAISAYEARAQGFEGLEAEIIFAASFGRRLDYYTGFAFEIYDADNRAKGPLAGGGRYDSLMEMLGSKALPAVGFSLWLDRLAEGVTS